MLPRNFCRAGLIVVAALALGACSMGSFVMAPVVIVAPAPPSPMPAAPPSVDSKGNRTSLTALSPR